VALPEERSVSVAVQLDDAQQSSLQRSEPEFMTLVSTAGGERRTFLLHVKDVVDGVLNPAGVLVVAGGASCIPIRFNEAMLHLWPCLQHRAYGSGGNLDVQQRRCSHKGSDGGCATKNIQQRHVMPSRPQNLGLESMLSVA
jgi:hypothetical protein